MSGKPIQHMVVLVPGIMGSVLQRNDQDVWNVPRNGLWVFSQRGNCENLTIRDEDDPDQDYSDGIEPTALVNDAYLIPGFWKASDGYQKISGMISETIQTGFGEVTHQVVGGAINTDDTQEVQFIEFAYDWRRDITAASRLLKKLIDHKFVDGWRKSHPDAKVIFIAHSMGGLVVRDYLEHRGGSEFCKALITLATPYRGSVKALNYLANGHHEFPLLDLSEQVRSFTSVYQMLPAYPMVYFQGKYEYAENIVHPQLNQEKVKWGRKFLRSLKSESDLNYEGKLVIGTGKQETYQSATLSGQLLAASCQLPPDTKENREPLPIDFTGDNTVPYIAAQPFDNLKFKSFDHFGTIHSSIQAHPNVLEWLREVLLKQFGIDRFAGFQNPQETRRINQDQPPPAINLNLKDVYKANEKIEIDAEIVHVDLHTLKKAENFGGLNAVITPVSGQQRPNRESFIQTEDTQYVLTLPQGLPPGLYRLKVKIASPSGNTTAPIAMQDVFQVID
jgi:pimeloyl-ACP methyl ester carboxylesterase